MLFSLSLKSFASIFLDIFNFRSLIWGMSGAQKFWMSGAKLDNGTILRIIHFITYIILLHQQEITYEGNLSSLNDAPGITKFF